MLLSVDTFASPEHNTTFILTHTTNQGTIVTLTGWWFILNVLACVGWHVTNDKFGSQLVRCIVVAVWGVRGVQQWQWHWSGTWLTKTMLDTMEDMPLHCHHWPPEETEGVRNTMTKIFEKLLKVSPGWWPSFCEAWRLVLKTIWY